MLHRAAVPLTVDEGAVEPLDVVVLGEAEQDLVGEDRERQEQHRSHGHGQSEGAQPQPTERRQQCYKYRLPFHCKNSWSSTFKRGQSSLRKGK